MTAPVLMLDSVSVKLSRTPVLQGVSARFAPGQFVAVLGPNGAGKSTLLRAIAGLQPANGTIHVGETALQGLSLAARARLIGYLPQGHQTHWPLSVAEIVGLGRYAHGATDPLRLTLADQTAVASAMAATGVDAFSTRRATDLSGGERARVALARVLAQETPIILADEPTASLDPKFQLEVMDLLATIARSGRLVLAVTHDLDLAMRFADRVAILDQGRLVAEDAPENALSDALCRTVFGLARGAPAASWEIAR